VLEHSRGVWEYTRGRGAYPGAGRLKTGGEDGGERRKKRTGARKRDGRRNRRRCCAHHAAAGDMAAGDSPSPEPPGEAPGSDRPVVAYDLRRKKSHRLAANTPGYTSR